MSKRDKILLWLLGLALLGGFLYAVGSILLPFVVGLIAAYFLDPAAGRLNKHGISRGLATFIITILFFTIVISVTIMLAPVFYNQFLNLLDKMPDYMAYINDKIVPSFAHALEEINPDALEKVKDSVGEASSYALQFLGKVAGNIWQSGMAVMNVLSLLFITPVVTFYMLRDWDKIVRKVDSWLPTKQAPVIREQARIIDNTLAGFIRGQTYVCLILGSFYAIALTAAGLDFGLFIGMATGILMFIPYVGFLFGFLIGMLVAVFQFANMFDIGIILGIFMFGQLIESTIITPNLVGNKVGLHPVWIIFSLLAGGSMFGFLGILLAVPVAAVIGVLARFCIREFVKA